MSTSVVVAQGVTYGALGMMGVLGGGLTVAVTWAGTMPLHASIRTTLSRVWAWARKAVRFALVAFAMVLGLRWLHRVAVTYFHLGWRGQRHTLVTRGRHRPSYVRAHPWTPTRGWSVTA